MYVYSAGTRTCVLSPGPVVIPSLVLPRNESPLFGLTAPIERSLEAVVAQFVVVRICPGAVECIADLTSLN
jgi:hypothetical protein